MNNLSEQMQSRLEKWRKNTIPVASKEKIKQSYYSRRSSKGDFGDAMSIDDWDLEVKNSQFRK